MQRQQDFAQLGVEILPVTSNSEELARASHEEWGLGDLPIGYGLTREDASRWGLFVSSALKDTEPAWFTEPALFFVRPGGELYASVIQTMPFARPTAEQLHGTISWILENEYPARGELA